MLSVRSAGSVWTLVLLALFTGWVGSAHAAAARAEKPKPAELLTMAKKASNPPQDRTEAISELGRMGPAQEVRDHKVVEGLLEIALNKKDDHFVRIAAFEGLGNLEFSLFQTDNYAKNRYVEPFMNAVKDKAEDELVREVIAKNFQRTLKPTGLKDKEAFEVLAKIAEDKTESLLVRIACVDFIGAFGFDKGIGVLANILSQLELDSQLRLAVVTALGELLKNIDDVKEIPFPVIAKIKDLVLAKEIPTETRASALKALARLKAMKVKGVDDSALEVIKQVLKSENDPNLIVAAIEALGIIADDKALEDLKKAYADFFDEKTPNRANDVRIRIAIMKVLGYLLSAQNQAANPNAASLKASSELLLKGIEVADAKLKEQNEVAAAAIFSLRYLYPKKKEFQALHKDVIDKLVLLLKPHLKLDESLVQSVTETLKMITRQPFGKDPARWDKWYDEAYGKK